MKMRDLIKGFALFLIITLLTSCFTSCVQKREKPPAVTTEAPETTDIAEVIMAKPYPENESEMAEVWRYVISERKYDIENITMVDLFQEDVRSAFDYTFYEDFSDEALISEFLDILTKSEMEFQKVSADDVKLYDYEGKNIRDLHLNVFINGVLVMHEIGLDNRVVNSELGFSIERDGYIYIHLPSNIDYTYRSVTPVSFDDIHAFYKKTRNQ